MRLILCAAALFLLAWPGVGAAAAAGADRGATLALLCSGDGADVVRGLAAVEAAAPTDADWASGVLGAFARHALTCPPDGRLAPLPSLRARRLIEGADAVLTLFRTGAGRQERLDAAATLGSHPDTLPADLVASALTRTRDPAVAGALRGLLVETGLSSTDRTRRLAAVRALGADASDANATRLAALRQNPLFASDPASRRAVDRAIARVRFWLRVGNVLSLLYNGVSAGSVLFLSSVGLAIIFGLMGVINLAQGELITIGAYTTFTVQEAMARAVPGLLGWFPVVSIPVVFLVTGLVGVAIELLVIRHLYRRPLMTLLATWAVSLLLANSIRVLFGTQNLRFDTPSWLTGGVRVLGSFIVTWDHLFAICFAAGALAATAALLRFTDIGLFIRAVTQNRGMAGCVGISTRRVDMLAFGFGAGLAGLGGLALSPIYNVNPTMGSGFIIDSFMVVVLGGVGSLLGTALAAFGIGLVDVGIEPFYGAVAAKVIALLLIILLIQFRPEGLVPARGRR